ncbi:MAG: hypothetical protein A3K67_05910 [Euryarchaeota archaeon RBG_16_62_10]|nr:MAG: hypothetical protein A3K67_05910 [Euryarchaeota archaeon RBG_16_62_10]
MRVELDKKSLFALASDTRLEILHSLQPMRRTVTQLSESLGIDKAAVHRHLKKMEEGGLVKRYEDHGFVYYGLSWKARDLLSPNENTRIVIMLSSSWLMVIGILFLVVLGAAMGATDYAFGNEPRSAAPNQTSYDGGEAAPDSMLSLVSYEPSDLLWIVPSIVLGSTAITLTILSIVSMRKPKSRSPTEGPQ